jgi:hypothetical protein
MRRAIASLIGASTLLTTALAADGCWDLCQDACWEAGVEALWWKPCSCTYEYALARTPLSNITIYDIEAVKPSHEWGFRLFGTRRGDCNFLSLEWLYLRPSSLSVVEHQSNILSPVLPIAGLFQAEEVTGKVCDRYNKVNLRGGYYLHQGCNLDLYSYAGIRWIQIEEVRKVHANNSVQIVRFDQKSKFNGGGFELGLGGEYSLGCCFGLTGRVGVVAAIGDKALHSTLRGEFLTPPSDPTLAITDTDYPTPSRTDCVWGTEFQIGINYVYECGCWTLVGEIGYAMDYYLKALTVMNTSLTSVGSTGNFLTTDSDIGFAGPYVSLSLCF